MLERLLNFSLTQRFLVCFAGLVLMCSGFCAFRHVVCYFPKQPGAA
jgi:Cu/Ag efflux pump CusA